MYMVKGETMSGCKHDTKQRGKSFSFKFSFLGYM